MVAGHRPAAYSSNIIRGNVVYIEAVRLMMILDKVARRYGTSSESSLT
jgi:hypothetical protein